MDALHASLGENELELLKLLWLNGPGTARRILELAQEQGRTWAYTTVLTMLQRLEAKGFVQADRAAVAHVFSPAVSRDGLLRSRLEDLARQLCGGLASPLVQALVEGKRFTADEIQQFRSLLDELEGQKRDPGLNRPR